MMQGWADFLDEARKSAKGSRRVGSRGGIKRPTVTHGRALQPTA
jgi:hypothetical protein